MIIEERSRDIGDFLVGMLIPFRKKRMIGPFIFIDHMGPTQLGPSKYMDVDQHPHIGLATLTYMLEGELIHEDSLGTHQRITPGSVNWMIAGKGVSHTERTPPDLRNGKKFTAHGYQIWVALPKAKEGMPPEFHHMPAETLPKWQDGPAQFHIGGRERLWQEITRARTLRFIHGRNQDLGGLCIEHQRAFERRNRHLYRGGGHRSMWAKHKQRQYHGFQGRGYL